MQIISGVVMYTDVKKGDELYFDFFIALNVCEKKQLFLVMSSKYPEDPSLVYANLFLVACLPKVVLITVYSEISQLLGIQMLLSCSASYKISF